MFGVLKGIGYTCATRIVRDRSMANTAAALHILVKHKEQAEDASRPADELYRPAGHGYAFAL